MAVPNTNGVKRTKIETMKIGDYIECEYVHPANIAKSYGEIKNIGSVSDETAEIDNTAKANVDGKFYFLKVDKGLLIADRMINQIYYKYLNLHNLTCGIKINMNDRDFILRILTKNEYIKYVLNSDLNGNINHTDNTIFNRNNNSSIYTALQNGFYGYTSYNNVSRSTFYNYTSANNYTGFRPALEYIDVDNKKSTNLYY